MSCYSEFYECFENDNCDKIEDLVTKHTLLPAMTAAATYSGKGKLSANMVRRILNLILTELDMSYAIVMANDIINGNEKHMVDDSVLRLIQRSILSQEGPDVENVRSSRQSLIEHIGTCQNPVFDRFLSFITESGMYFVLPDGVTLSVLERIRRRLGDDRAYFLVLHSAILAEAFECLITSISNSGEVTTSRLEEYGYEVEAVPGTVNAFIVRPPGGQGAQTDEIGSTPQTPNQDTHYVNPNSGVNWVANHSRRDYGRRRRR